MWSLSFYHGCYFLWVSFSIARHFCFFSVELGGRGCEYFHAKKNISKQVEKYMNVFIPASPACKIIAVRRTVLKKILIITRVLKALFIFIHLKIRWCGFEIGVLNIWNISIFYSSGFIYTKIFQLVLHSLKAYYSHIFWMSSRHIHLRA